MTHDSRLTTIILVTLTITLLITACSDDYPDDILLFTNVTIWDGTDQSPAQNSALITHNGKVLEIIDMTDPDFPEEADAIDLGGRYLIPGLINAHGHVGMARGLETGTDIHSEENVIEQLQLYARYGVTTVVSLGDEPDEAFTVRDRQNFSESGMARLFLAGPVLNPATPEEAHDAVNELALKNPDWSKIRVDDGLGTREKMNRETYAAIIEASHSHNIPLAAHIVTLEDAKGVVDEGADLVAHSVRDTEVDQDLISLMLDRDICLTPTLTREISVFIYAERPDFFDDPFFLDEADPEVIEQLQQPEIQERFTGRAANFYSEALSVAKGNMMSLHNTGVRIAMGTDSGPPARFQGYFEHLEMEMMQDSGMTPLEVLTSATRYAAECMQIDEELGTLEKGKHADFVVVDDNPFDDIRNLREIYDVYIGAQRVYRGNN